MTTPDARTTSQFVYRKVVPPERLTYVNAFSDAQGNTALTPAPSP